MASSRERFDWLKAVVANPRELWEILEEMQKLTAQSMLDNLTARQFNPSPKLPPITNVEEAVFLIAAHRGPFQLGVMANPGPDQPHPGDIHLFCKQ